MQTFTFFNKRQISLVRDAIAYSAYIYNVRTLQNIHQTPSFYKEQHKLSMYL